VTVKPVLGSWEIPNIAAMRTLEQRPFVELAVPGREGSLFQDVNAAPTRIVIQGSLFGDQDRDTFLQDVRTRFLDGQPLTFVADIITATSIQYMLIEVLRVAQSGTRPDELEYLIVMRESPPPPPPPSPVASMNAGLLNQAASFTASVTGALDVIDTLGNLADLGLGSVPNLVDPTPPLTGALANVTSAMSGLESVLDPLRTIFGSD
jgi:hypothetical protein